MAIYSYQMIFCAKYLRQRGINTAESLKAVADSDLPYEYLLVPQKKNFYTELAEKLRALWPAGNKTVSMKNGDIHEYAWRDSVSNLSKRLENVWKDRGLSDNYTVEDCLTAARRYLKQFENNTKYMQTLKYFILKQENIMEPKTGKIVTTNKSTFADYLTDDTNKLYNNELEEMLEDTQLDYGGDLV